MMHNTIQLQNRFKNQDLPLSVNLILGGPPLGTSGELAALVRGAPVVSSSSIAVSGGLVAKGDGTAAANDPAWWRNDNDEVDEDVDGNGG